MLALYAAASIKDGKLSHDDASIHLCTTHRHIRYQAELSSFMLPHFGIFTIISAGKSRSSYAFEIEALLFHLRFYADYWQRRHGGAFSVTFNRRVGYKDSEGFFIRVVDAVKEQFTDMEITINEKENGSVYYQGLQATLTATVGGESIEIGDLGFVDWTQQLLNQKSERLLISAMALDRQL